MVMYPPWPWRGRGSQLKDRSRSLPRLVASSVWDPDRCSNGKRRGTRSSSGGPESTTGTTCTRSCSPTGHPAGAQSRRWTRGSARTCGRSMRAADTNILVRLAARDDAAQLAAARAFVAGGVWASQLVLAETAWVLQASYAFDDAELITALEVLLNHVGLVVQDADVALAALALFRKRPALGF